MKKYLYKIAEDVANELELCVAGELVMCPECCGVFTKEELNRSYPLCHSCGNYVPDYYPPADLEDYLDDGHNILEVVWRAKGVLISDDASDKKADVFLNPRTLKYRSAEIVIAHPEAHVTVTIDTRRRRVIAQRDGHEEEAAISYDVVSEFDDLMEYYFGNGQY